MVQRFDVIEKAFLNGQWVDAKTNLTVYNPATREKIGTIPNLGAEETKQAIEAAAVAFKTWSRTTAIERADLLLKWHELISKNKEALAFLLSLEGGKPLAEARGELGYGLSFIRWFAEEARRTDGDVIPTDNPQKRYLVVKQPVGVVGAITPWNFPHAMITRKCAPAFAAGCTVVLKPSELTPFSALALAKLAEEAGFPKGVFNVVTGDAEPIGQALCDDARVRKISFTGSTRVGQWLAEKSAKTLKTLSLELGGNAPFIIFDDANVDKVVKELLACKFRNGGQTCVCANRIFVQEKIYSEFLKLLVPAVQALKVGLAFQDETVNVGPLINQAGLDKVNRLVADALNKGAKCLLGGKPHALGGHFYEPTVLVDITDDMEIAHEEIFGPVIALQKFVDEGAVVKAANNTQAGLASYVFTENASRVWRLTHDLEYGMVGANTGVFSSAIAPFGGVKFSGYGREGSKYGIEEYLEIKCLCWDVG